MDGAPFDGSSTMTCTEFLAGFSEFYDGDPALADRGAFETHVAGCASCARYLSVIQKGADLLRDLPPSTPRDDFRDRLRFSIYRFEEERRRDGNTFGASRVMLLVAAAAMLTALVGAPLVLDPEHSVELAPILAERPADLPSPASLASPEPPSSGPLFGSSDLWAGSNVLLYEHSRLYQRYRDPGLVRTGLR